VTRDSDHEEASRELARILQAALAASESSALRKRKDLVGFFDALYAAAIAFGLSVFYDNYKRTLEDVGQVNKNFLLLYILPGIAVLAAVAFILDDWRQARWLIIDYGYRTQHRQRIMRFWIDGLLVVLAFFITASAFSHPAAYLSLLGMYVFLGWLWVRLLRSDINRYVSDKGAYPHNSLGLRITTETSADERNRVVDLDYRIKQSQWADIVLCLVLLGIGLFLGRLKQAPSALEWDIQCWASLGPVLCLGIMKGFCHHTKGICVETIRKLGRQR